VVDKLFEIGIAQGAGIFFFLFVALGVVFYMQNKSIMKQNDSRESRYISTIDKLADSLSKVESVNQNIMELRQDFQKASERQESMIGRLLDRVPVKGGSR